MSRNIKYLVKSVAYQIARKPPFTNCGKKSRPQAEARPEQDSLENETGNREKACGGPELPRFENSRNVEMTPVVLPLRMVPPFRNSEKVEDNGKR
jgi:hypothetical protein